MSYLAILLGMLAHANADAATERAREWDRQHCEYFNPNDPPSACADSGADISCEPSLQEAVNCTWIAGHSPVELACGGIFEPGDCDLAD